MRRLLDLLLLPLVTLSLTGTLTSALDDHAGTGAVVVVGGGVPRLGCLVLVPSRMPLAEHHLLVVVPLARGRRRPGGHLAHPEVGWSIQSLFFNFYVFF